MSTDKKLSKIDKTKASKILFALVFILSCLTMNSSELNGYNGNHSTLFLFIKFALIIVFLIFVSLINRGNTDFVTKSVCLTLLIVTPVLIFDYYVTKISGIQFLYRVCWIAYIMVAAATVFLVLTMIKPKNYKNFYYSFFRSFSPLYMFTLYIGFLRKPNTGFSYNFKLGKGTFPLLLYIIKYPKANFEYYLIFFGNIIIFFPLPFILSAVFTKMKTYQAVLIGMAAPFIVEGYQYLFKCGNVDIDDVVLNWLGFFIGLAIQQIIKKRLLTENE